MLCTSKFFQPHRLSAPSPASPNLGREELAGTVLARSIPRGLASAENSTTLTTVRITTTADSSSPVSRQHSPFQVLKACFHQQGKVAFRLPNPLEKRLPRQMPQG